MIILYRKEKFAAKSKTGKGEEVKKGGNGLWTGNYLTYLIYLTLRLRNFAEKGVCRFFRPIGQTGFKAASMGACF
jgi:hypothetical protein